MKKSIAILAAAALMLASCGQPLTYQGKEYPTHGLLNEDSSKSNNMCYELSVGNLILSIVLVETIVAPVYFLGFSLFNPVGPKDPVKGCGIDAQK